jgi:surfactin synthase thioesterase subunit
MTLKRISDTWFPYRGRSRPAVRLFCLPFAGAGASSFASLSRRLGSTVEVCAAQLPGRESRMQERCIDSVEALVAALESPMRELMDCPYAILGYSMGASIALELCRRLRGGILPLPVALFVVGAPGPRAPKRPPIAGLSHEAFIEELRRLGGTSQAVLENQTLLDTFLPVLRADFALIESYDYSAQEPLSLPTFAYAGESDALAPPASVARWSDEVDGPFQMRRFAGGHFFVQSNLDAVADAILRDLEGCLMPPSNEFESAGPTQALVGDAREGNAYRQLVT